MKRSHVVLLILMVTMIAPLAAMAQFVDFPGYLEMNTMGGGARAAGMGGAFMGISEGEMAYSWNPAGMIFEEKRSVGLEFWSVNDKFSAVRGYTYVPSSDLLTIHTFDFKREHTNLNYSGFNVPFTFFDKNWAVGGGFHNVFDMKLDAEAPGIYGSKDIYTASSGVDAVSLGLSGKIMENIALGVTVNNYVRGSERNLYWGNIYAYQSQPNAPVDSIDYRYNSIDHYSGVNFDIGLMGTFNMFKGGVVIHSPFDLKQKSKFTEYLMVPPTPIGTITRATTTTNMPLGFTIGVSAAPTEQLTVALDYFNRPMSKVEFDVNYESYYYDDYKDDPQWEDISQFRIGAEYKLKTEFATIPVRLGFRNNPSVEKEIATQTYNETDSTMSYTYGDQINANILTLGTGLHFERGWIDFAYQFGSSSYTSEVTFYGTGSTEIKNDYSKLFISAGMNF